MPTSTNVTNLKINELTESQYDTAVQQGVIGANEISILTDAEAGQVIQVATLPTASADELGNIYQFVGTTDANYTNGYFYKCVSDGQQPATYSWSNIQVQASSGGLPTQTGNAGKFLITDGTDAIWSDTATGLIQINHAPGTNDSELRFNTYFTNRYFGWKTNGGSNHLGFRVAGTEKGYFDSYGSYVPTTNNATLGSDVGQFVKVCTKALSNNGYNYLDVPNFEGTFVSVGKVCAQLFSMPNAASKYLDYIVQYIGATDSTYTNGHFYKCVSDGQDPATYSWTEVQLGGGGSSYTAGTGIDITSGVISVTSPTLQNTATGTDSLTISGTASVYNYGINIGFGSTCGGDAVVIGYNANGDTNGIAIGKNVDNKSYGGAVVIGSGSTASTGFNYGIAIGAEAKITANNCIQLNASGSTKTNSDANTFKVGNANGNYEMMSADGTIPTARLTKVNSTITLTAAGWSSNTQTVNVTGMTATGVVFPCPIPADQSAYTSAGILCTAQAAGTLTFTCDTVPSADIDVNVVML